MSKEASHIAIFIGLLVLNTILATFIFSFFYTVDDILGISPSGYLMNGVISQLVVFVLTFALYLKITSTSFTELIWVKKIDKRWVLWSIIIVALSYFVLAIASYINGLIELVYPNHELIIHNHDINALQVRVLKAFGGLKMAYTIIVIGIVPAIAEELVFRGFLFRKLFDLSGNSNLAIAISALIFALVHFQILNVLPIFIMGYILGYVYFNTRNIIYPMLIHFLYNTTQVILTYYL